MHKNKLWYLYISPNSIDKNVKIVRSDIQSLIPDRIYNYFSFCLSNKNNCGIHISFW